ncbi:hypothetical protein INR49_016921, partial [Caranx melampygus]
SFLLTRQDVCDPPVVLLKDCTSVYKLQGFCLKAPDSHQPPSNMKLLLAVCLTWALLHTAESLRCHTCSNDMCTNTTSVQCPATSTACQTITSVTGTGSSANVIVNKTCSTLQTCITPVNMATEWSINRGFIRSAHNQICCVSDNCNFQTLATPSTTENGKVCPACASAADSNAGTCNATLVCVGAEDSCFSGNTSTRCVDILQQGCLTRNLCSTPLILNALFGDNSDITCGAPNKNRPDQDGIVHEWYVPGQQPPGAHPVGGPGGPGQPGFPGTAPRPQGSNTLVDELEASFEACFASLVSQDYVNGTDQEEIRTGVDQCIQKFLDVARQTECFFLQKRLQLSVQKPEQVVKEDVSELRNELQRKELLVQKHLSKLHHWQQVLEDVSVQHRKPSDLPPPGPLAFLEQASASLPPAPLKPN